MKIALIQCPVWGTYDPPLALARLSSCLKKDGHEVFVLDMNIKLYLRRTENYKNMWAWEQSQFWYNQEYVAKFFSDNSEIIDSYVQELVNKKVKAVGFSVTAASWIASLEVAKRFKRLNDRIVIIFGGPLFWDDRFIGLILNNAAVDILVIGEGELTSLEVLKFLEYKKDMTLCKGLALRKDNKVVITGSRELLPDLDALPFLDFDELLFSDYDDKRHFPFMASRGCVLNCVFCSSRAFWSGFRVMSGERIFSEIEYHKLKLDKINPDVGHVDFMDLVFNGNMKSLITFCNLMSKAQLDLKWTANMIIKPELTSDVIKKMKEAGCEHVIFGIESGSPNVLKLMRKYFKIEDANRIVKDLHEAGITVTCNFMFGFPGETEEDFQLTLDFLNKNHAFLDRVYPSRTYCAIEDFSYLNTHLEEFGIKMPPPNHLYWESIDGKNTYPVRLEKCERFCKLAYSLGIEVGSGVQTSTELDKYYNLGFYYDFKGEYSNAIKYFLNYHNLDSQNEVINKKLFSYAYEFENHTSRISIDKDLMQAVKEATASFAEEKREQGLSEGIARLGRQKNIALFKQIQQENSALNDREYESGQLSLKSSPKTFFLQAAGPCNSYCVFCSRGRDYDFFDLDTYKERFEEKINSFLIRAERIILTGSGEYLFLKENKAILDYFDNRYPHVEKMFSTNGSSLTPDICERIAYSKSKYTIHVSLHASDIIVHMLLTRTKNFNKIIKHLKYLMELKRKTGNPELRLIFVATTLNIEELPNFVKLSADLGADRVICYYNYIYVPAQKYLSCFFKQHLTNKMLDESAHLASRLNINIELPPRFGLPLEDYPQLGPCREAWSQIMLNSKGDIIPCDASEDTYETIEGKNFIDVWNGKYYIMLRDNLINRKAPCFFHCLRANPSLVNNFSSHVIHRGRKDSLINEFWEDNF
jgi:radical SAM superfamily enzyme YgiQ (UPF0313 family)/wyosine [tRNA(Phe)-imidazoG37] synthetase (radical SAM superfamily)